MSPDEALVLFAVIDSAGEILAMTRDGFDCGCRSACSRVAKDCRVPSLDSLRSATPMIHAARVLANELYAALPRPIETLAKESKP